MAGSSLTKGLQNLRRQVDAAFPDRDRTSDGWIGDLPHQGETSGHNPDDTPGSRPAWNGDPDSTPEVRAWDMDSDLRSPGVTAQDVVDHLRRLPGLSGVIRYMIYNRRMYHEQDGFTPTAYTGASAHTEHVHFEGAWTQAADSDQTVDYRLEDLVALTEEQTRTIVREELDAYSRRDPIASVYARSGEQRTRMGTALATLAAISGKDMVDEPAIVAGVLAGLTPEKIAAAIPGDVAEQVVSLLAARLAS